MVPGCLHNRSVFLRGSLSQLPPSVVFLFEYLNVSRSSLLIHADHLVVLPSFLGYIIAELGERDPWIVTSLPRPLFPLGLYPMVPYQADPWRGQNLLSWSLGSELAVCISCCPKDLEVRVIWSGWCCPCGIFHSLLHCCSQAHAYILWKGI